MRTRRTRHAVGAQPQRSADHPGRQRQVRVEEGGAQWLNNRRQRSPSSVVAHSSRRIKAALAANATADGNVVTFKVEDRDAGDAQRSESRRSRRIPLQTLSSATSRGDHLSDYADFGGVQFPRHIVEKQDGFETLDVNITDVKPNAPVSLEVPANVASASSPYP